MTDTEKALRDIIIKADSIMTQYCGNDDDPINEEMLATEMVELQMMAALPLCNNDREKALKLIEKLT